MVCSAHVISSLSIEPSDPWDDPVEALRQAARVWIRSISACTNAHASCSACSADTAAGSCRAVASSSCTAFRYAGGEAEFGGLALVADDRHRQAPAFARLADHVRGRHAGAVEGHLAELGRDAVDHLQRPLFDARLVHRHGERGQPLVLGDVGIGAGQHDAPLGDVGVARPDLVAVDDVLVAVERRRGAQRREVGPGVGLAETLAPPVLAVDEPRQEPILDRLAAVMADPWIR